jgi:hypothetical protein
MGAEYSVVVSEWKGMENGQLSPFGARATADVYGRHGASRHKILMINFVYIS